MQDVGPAMKLVRHNTPDRGDRTKQKQVRQELDKIVKKNTRILLLLTIALLSQRKKASPVMAVRGMTRLAMSQAALTVTGYF
jgi:mannose/fructose/N-acetylgalactosamine-specific phosphotransferase system component IID